MNKEGASSDIVKNAFSWKAPLGDENMARVKV